MMGHLVFQEYLHDRGTSLEWGGYLGPPGQSVPEPEARRDYGKVGREKIQAYFGERLCVDVG